MANHKSTLKRMRSTQTRRLQNSYYSKTVRNAVRRFLNIEDKKEAEERLPKVASMVDKLARKNILHKNKAGNIKSRLSRHINGLA